MTFKSYINYIGQLRFYSYVDILLLLYWLEASPIEFVGCSIMWFGFLIQLETIHKDNGRLRWHWVIWIVLWIISFVILQTATVFLFFVVSFLYTLKKNKYFGFFSSMLNGLVKVALVLHLPAASSANLLIVFSVMTFRNMMGDFRDAGKDSKEGMRTLPVVLGMKRNMDYIYPVSLAMSSASWAYLGQIPLVFLGFAWVVQLITYHWTPR